MLMITGCEEASKTKPGPQSPAAGISAGAGSTEPSSGAPPVRPDVSKALPAGLLPGERYHDLHTSKLNLKCETCHVKQVETYYDPMAQVSNPVDNRACLSCHAESSVQPLYGANWGKASVKK